MTDVPEPPSAPPPEQPPEPQPEPLPQAAPQPAPEAAPQAVAAQRPPWLPIAIGAGAALLLLVGFLVFRSMSGGAAQDAYTVEAYTPQTELITASDRVAGYEAPDVASAQ